MGTTNKELVEILQERNHEGKYDRIINRAKENGYHDFKFDEDKYPDCICPKIDLVADLMKFPELLDVRQSVIDGDFDESPDQEDRDKMEQEMPFLKNAFEPDEDDEEAFLQEFNLEMNEDDES